MTPLSAGYQTALWVMPKPVSQREKHLTIKLKSYLLNKSQMPLRTYKTHRQDFPMIATNLVSAYYLIVNLTQDQ